VTDDRTGLLNSDLVADLFAEHGPFMFLLGFGQEVWSL